jgi:hypothetical protein
MIRATKQEVLADPQSSFNRTADDEPIFVLCGRDRLALDAVRYWASIAREHGAPAEKFGDALELADRMEQWQKDHGSKIPD